MAELKNYVMGVIAILFIATATVSIYSTAITNNLNSGGNGTTIPFPLLNQTTAYEAEMKGFSSGLSNGTLAASSTPSTGLGSVGGGIGAITQAGTGAISLSFGAVKILVTMAGSMKESTTMIGIPGFIFDFGILALAVSIVFAILAAVFKWWI